MHRATVLLWVYTVVAFHAALIGGGAVGAAAKILALVPAGVHWIGPCGDLSVLAGIWPGSQVSRSRFD